MKGRPVLFGETLYDHFADGQSVLGGAPFNVAWHLQAFGMSPLLISRIGDDDPGRQILAVMQDWGMDTAGIQVDAQHRTGVVNVTLVGAEPRYEIVADRAYDHIDSRQLPALDEAVMLYHGTLACRSGTSRETLEYLRSAQSMPRFVDINLRAPHYNHASMLQLIQGASWLKLNAAEFKEIISAISDRTQANKDFLETFDLDGLVITRAEEGAEIRTRDGSRFFVRPSETIQITDTVGAGDGFSSVLMIGQLKGWSLQDSLARANEFAQAVIGVRGATVADINFYQDFRRDWGLT